MLRRRFGRTEIMMPVLTSGGMRYQQSWTPSEPVSSDNQANLQRVIERAMQLGINHFETARGYGTSEKQLGQILPGLPRDQLVVQTKVAPTRDPDQFERDFFDSLGRLQLSHVDLLGLHGINDDGPCDWALREKGCLERALQLKAKGFARHVGFSTHGPLPLIQRAIRDGRFEYVNLHYYWAFQDNLPAIREAAARDMGILIISPNDKGGRLYEPPEKLRQLTMPLSPMVYNDLFCLAHPEIHTLSIGNRLASDFDEHLRAVELLSQHPLDVRSLVAPIEARLWAEYERVLGHDFALTWREGLPTWKQAPGHINVREILRLYNLARVYDLVAHGRDRYGLFENGDHWFPGNPAERIDEDAWRKALSASPHAERIIEALGEAERLLGGAKKKRLQVE